VEIEKPNLVFNGKLIPLKKVDKIICHHPMHPNWRLNEIHLYHRDKRNYIGIGYNYFVTFDGRIQEGRGRNQGAHTLGGWNTKSLGVCFQGDFSKQLMTDSQVDSGAELIASLIKNEGLTINDVVGHGDLWNTACPGKNFRMTDLKNAILNELNPNMEGERDKMLLKIGDRSSDVKTLQENLNKLGHNAGAVDGIFGPSTDKALKSFQRAAGITVDGIAGPQTFAKITALTRPVIVKKENATFTLGGKKYKIEEV